MGSITLANVGSCLIRQKARVVKFGFKAYNTALASVAQLVGVFSLN